MLSTAEYFSTLLKIWTFLIGLCIIFHLNTRRKLSQATFWRCWDFLSDYDKPKDWTVSKFLILFLWCSLYERKQGKLSPGPNFSLNSLSYPLFFLFSKTFLEGVGYFTELHSQSLSLPSPFCLSFSPVQWNCLTSIPSGPLTKNSSGQFSDFILFNLCYYYFLVICETFSFLWRVGGGLLEH